MKMKHHVSIATVLWVVCSVGVVLSGWMTLDQVKRNHQLKVQCDRLTKINLKAPGKMQQLKKQIAQDAQIKKDLAREIIRRNKAAVVYQFFRECGTLYANPWVTIDFVYDCICWNEKYAQYGKGFDYDGLDPENFFLCWIINESLFNKNSRRENWEIIKGKRKKTIDIGIPQINSCNWHYFDEIPEAFKFLRTRPNIDPEKSILVWNMWMGKQHTHSVWDIWKKWKKRDDVMKLWSELKGVR